MGISTISGIVEEVCNALWTHFQPLVLREPSIEDWKNIAADFKNITQFDHCIGAIDGKHVIIQTPPKSGTDFYNYKKTFFFSFVLLAVADANNRLLYIDVGSMGRFSDGGILTDSIFGQKLRSEQLNLPPDEPLCNGGPEIPYVLVGDEAFPLERHIMRAYPKDKLTDSRRIFNYRLSRARQVIEHTFGLLATKWRVYRRPFECRVQLVDIIVKATCVLHNFLIENKYYNSTTREPLNTNQLIPLTHSGFTYSNDNFFIREEFCRYFNTIGQVSWQNTRIHDQLSRMQNN